MYMPAHFEETRPEVLRRLIHDHPLAALVTLGSDGLNANHIPMELDADPAPLGTLRGHVARANPVWRDFSPGVDALAIFQGPQAYVSPGWYQTKQETGKVVPTYNYAVVHASGPMRIIEDRAWLRAFVERLTNRHEAGRSQSSSSTCWALLSASRSRSRSSPASGRSARTCPRRIWTAWCGG